MTLLASLKLLVIPSDDVFRVRRKGGGESVEGEVREGVLHTTCSSSTKRIHTFKQGKL